VRSALKAVNGVTRVQIKWPIHEAIVTYDPRKATTEQLLTAVKEAKGIFEYSATVKKPK
jgi:copper chaperone CopZ